MNGKGISPEEMPLIMVITFIHLILFSQPARNLGTTLAIAFKSGCQWDLFYPLLLLDHGRTFLKMEIFGGMIEAFDSIIRS